MKLLRTILILIAALVVGMPAAMAQQALITAQEAALPDAAGTIATRGISRGPSVKLASPEPDAVVKAPFNFKVGFEGRGGAKVDPASVKVTYLKSPLVNLTPRLKSAISANGINFTRASVPPGTHKIKVTVMDQEGRETNTVFTLIVE
ncbi:MAG: hypothetical protein WCP99_00650 [Burkholderiales bacterium]